LEERDAKIEDLETEIAELNEQLEAKDSEVVV
jgi:uncharacterized protein YceH (UPF0502 family)